MGAGMGFKCVGDFHPAKILIQLLVQLQQRVLLSAGKVDLRQRLLQRNAGGSRLMLENQRIGEHIILDAVLIKAAENQIQKFRLRVG